MNEQMLEFSLLDVNEHYSRLDGNYPGWTVYVLNDGSFTAWWSKITLEVFGLQVNNPRVKFAGKIIVPTQSTTNHAWQVTIPDNGKGLKITFE